MPWLRHHFYCEGCDGTWLVEADVAISGDCPFCSARDLFPYRSDGETAVMPPRLRLVEPRNPAKARQETRTSGQRPRTRAKAASR